MRHRVLPLCVMVIFGLAGLIGQSCPAAAQVPWLLRLAVSAALHSDPPSEPRTDRHAKLAQGYYFNTIPRGIGQTFVVVADVSKFDRANISSGAQINIPMLFVDDPTARVPNQILQEVGSKCQDGWATLQFVGKERSEEVFSITCGLRPSSDPAAIVKRSPDKPGEVEGERKSKVVNYLEVSVDSFDVSRQGEVRVTLRLKNIEPRLGLAVALKALHSDGIADFWKFFPMSDGRLSDNAGGTYNLMQASGIGFARESADWAILRAGEETFVTLVFSGPPRPATSFSLTFGIWMGYRTGPSNEQRHGSYAVHLADIRPRRS
jgi:hypothetical protein